MLDLPFGRDKVLKTIIIICNYYMWLLFMLIV